jgi:hypothetical protein
VADEIDTFLNAPAPPAVAQVPATATQAPDEIDHFLAAGPPPSAVVPPGQPPPPAPGSWTSYVPSAVRDFGAGLVQGGRNVAQTVGGFIDDAGNWVDARVPWLAAIDRATGVDFTRPVNQLQMQTENFRKQYGSSIPAGIGEVVGDIGATVPLTGAFGSALGAGARALPIIGRVAGPAVEGAVAGGAGNALISGGTGEDPGRALATGAAGGALLGGVPALVGAGVRALGGGVPSAISGIADRLGINLSTGQRTGGVAKRIEDVGAGIPGSGADQFARTQNSQIAGVIAREGGIPGPVVKLTPASVSDGLTAAGNRMETAASKIDVPGDNTTLGALGTIHTNASISGTDAPQAKTVATLNDRILNIMANNNGTMPGPDFQKFIAKGGELEAAINSSNPDVANAAQQVKDALLDAANRSGAASADAVKDLQTARYNYKVLKTAQPVINNSADGSDTMSQAALAARIRGGTQNPNFDMSRSGPGNNMQDLARLIEGIKPLRSSGTAERAAWYGALGIGGTGGAAYALTHPDQAEDFIGGTVPAAIGIGLAGRGLRFGGGLGIPGVSGVTGAANPLVPRLFGPHVGNLLLQPPPPNQSGAP